MSTNWPTLVKNLSNLNKKKGGATSKGLKGELYFCSTEAQFTGAQLKNLPVWQKSQLKNGSSLVFSMTGSGPGCWLQPRLTQQKDHYGFFAPTPYVLARDYGAAAYQQLSMNGVSSIEVHYVGDNEDEFLGLGVGLEMAAYHFGELWPKQKKVGPSINFHSKLKNQKDFEKQAHQLASSVNVARLAVDLPPNEMNPTTYGQFVKSLFPSNGPMKVQIWNAQRLQKEKMGLHMAVGKGSVDGPCLIHLKYRSPKCKDAPLGFVGKGITFDSGGLDIKPASGMRLMKKDMGGSASVLGLAHWVSQVRPKLNCDFYLAVAENSVSKEAFRPSDILTAKNGLTVEIHNTDAEGRLVLADALTLAVADKPKFIIDVATLTGAVKYGLGSATPGLFSNDDALAELLLRSSQRRGETAWRMPLVPGEKRRLRSDVADLVNCTDGFGGAITAALFLEKFVGTTPWAHFDIYGWNDRAHGAFSHAGGNGQLVQSLVHFLKTQEAGQ